MLSRTCKALGIRYEHLPALGIPSDLRRDLKTQADYDELFDPYAREHLPGKTESLSQIKSWIGKGLRVALTCFELHPHQCLRHCVAEALVELAETKRHQREYITIFVNGKQKRVKRPPTIDGIPVDDFIRNTADPIWLLHS